MESPLHIVGRLAPSPTGGLHLGHARTFLIAWVAARCRGGRIVLRIEDLDTGRVRPESIQGIYDDLTWLGLTWDEGPYIQSARLDLYQAALRVLHSENLIYPCTCTRSDIARAASAPHAEDEGPIYPGTCSFRHADDADSLNQAYAWRFRMPCAAISWDDQVRGNVAIAPESHGGDFVVARSNGSIAYQLAVVVDDAAMGVNLVVRGDDLVASTPRQIQLYRALDLTAPRFAHVPLAVGTDGRRLAKRDSSVKLETLRNSGVDPRELIGLLAMSCGWSDHQIASDPQDWRTVSDPLHIPKTPWIVTPEDLRLTLS